jgi:hypothetical protein
VENGAMNEVIDKLIREMRWRIRNGGAKYKPKQKEMASWGAFSISGWVPPLASLPLLLLTTIVLENQFIHSDADTILPLLWVVSVPLLFWLRGVLNFRFLLGAYKKLLSTNERFMLVEYTKYLQRQIARAKDEPVLGGAAEVQRLTELHAKLKDLLVQGAGRDAKPLRSDLADEAVLAEAMVDSYSTGAGDELARLDARLPDELRQRIADLDRESSAARPKVAQ